MPNKRGLLLVVAALLLASCGGPRKKTIAVIPKGTSHQFWVEVEKGARRAGAEFNVDIQWSGPAQETEYGRQLEIFEAMINRKVDGIAIAAIERKVLNQAFDDAAKAGIPVTIFDSGAETEKYVSFVATDNFEAGKLGARELAKLLGGKGEVALLRHMTGSVSTTDRERGFTDAIEKEFPNIKIVASQYGMADPAKALAAAENILTAHGEVKGFFASTEPSSIGVAQALKARGLNGKVKFVGFDTSAPLTADVEAGVIDALVIQDPEKMGFEAVKTVVDKIAGSNPPKKMDLPARIQRKGDK